MRAAAARELRGVYGVVAPARALAELCVPSTGADYVRAVRAQRDPHFHVRDACAPRLEPR